MTDWSWAHPVITTDMRSHVLLALGLLALVSAAFAYPSKTARQEIDPEYGIDVEGPEVEPPNMDDFLPSEIEAQGIAHLGMGIHYLADIASKGPEQIIQFIKQAGEDAAVPEAQSDVAKRGPGPIRVRGRGPKGGKGGRGGKGRGGPKPKSREEVDKFMEQIKEMGVYQTVISHVKMMSGMMSLAPAILEHATKGPDCQDCPELPQEVKDMIFGEMPGKGGKSESESESESEEDDDEEKLPYAMKGKAPRFMKGGNRQKPEGQESSDDGAYKMKGGRKGGKGRGPGKSGSSEEDEDMPYQMNGQNGQGGPESASNSASASDEEVDADFGVGVDAGFGQLPSQSEIVKRLVKLLAKKNN